MSQPPDLPALLAQRYGASPAYIRDVLDGGPKRREAIRAARLIRAGILSRNGWQETAASEEEGRLVRALLSPAERL